jgi:lipopolysaccharide/colanic/teichoic acid biosynthesis glycosyltransferase
MGKGKRMFDLVAASGALVLLAPVFLAVALAIKLDDGGPVFFRQLRVGQDRRSFRIWKLRTMKIDAERHGGALTVGRDSRITRVGHLLRASKLDELPQLFNVLVGDMSLVGPRPEVPRYVALYDDLQLRVLNLRPGITDPASIEYRDESVLLATATDPEAFYISQLMPEKIRINLEYAARATLFSDLQVIGRTLAVVIRPGSFRRGSVEADGSAPR